MPRIRSVHPGLFEDEAFAALSDAAQIFLVGIGTQADDQGVFEWKPIVLRMRLRPTKDGSVEPLLSELLAADLIRKYEINGAHYGAVRNFRRHQRPKSPSCTYPITEDIRKYVALSGPISEIAGVEGVNVSEPFGAQVSQFPKSGRMGGRDGGNPSAEEGKKESKEERKNPSQGKTLSAGHIPPRSGGAA